ncbi:MAG: Pr6Pr family membrane protein [Pseudomonadota bacterium]
MRLRRYWRFLVALLGWFALTLQFSLLVFNPAPPPAPVSILNFFSYFTILTNILVAVAMTVGAFAADSAFFNRAGVRAAIAVYIAIVGAVYFLILRHTWDPQGWQLVADRLLHYATPALYLVDWIAFAPKRGLKPSKIANWLIYPTAYGAYAIARGATTGFYAYPFLDASVLGYGRVLINMAILIAVFAVVSFALIAASKLPPQRAR